MAKKNTVVFLFIMILLGCLGWASCEPKEPECYQPVNVTLISGFVGRDTVRIVDSATNTDTFQLQYTPRRLLSPGMYALDVDSLYSVIGSANGEDRLSVPLNPRSDSMRYRFMADTSRKAAADTLTFYYTSSVHFISNDCGYTNYYQLDSVHTTKNVVDSIALVNNAVTNNQTNQARHVQLYFFD